MPPVDFTPAAIKNNEKRDGSSFVRGLIVILEVEKKYEIALLDSGVGGFSILESLQKGFSLSRFTYFYDNDFHPYGTKSAEQIAQRCEQVVRFLNEHSSPDVIVLACNTASTVALKHLRNVFPDSLFVGVVPAVKPAVKLTKNKKIAVMATPRTIEGLYLDCLIDDFAAGNEVYKIALPSLVEVVEAHMRDGTPNWLSTAHALEEVKSTGCDTVVLGCTHYPLVLAKLKQLCPDVLHWVDSSEAICRRVSSLLLDREPAEIAANTKNICYFSRLNDKALPYSALQRLGLHAVEASLL